MLFEHMKCAQKKTSFAIARSVVGRHVVVPDICILQVILN